MTNAPPTVAPRRVGIIGTGLQARRRIEAADGGVVAVAGQDPASGAAFAAAHGVRAEADWRALVGAADLDTVIVATPPHLHAEMSIAALEAGKHVLCEKPLARTGDEADRMIDAARAHGRVLACGFNHRHHPALAELRALIGKGRLGRVLWARCAYGIGGRDGYENEWRADPAQTSGGQLMEQGIHAVDLLRAVLGEVESVTAVRATRVWPAMAPLEDDAMALLRHESGAMATIHSSLTQWVNIFRLEIGGDAATAEVQGLAGSYGSQTLTVWDRTNGPFAASRTEFRGGDRSWRREWEEFSAMSTAPVDLSSAVDGAHAVRVVEAAYQGADGDRWVRPARPGAKGPASAAPEAAGGPAGREATLAGVLELLRPLLPDEAPELTPETRLFSSRLLDSLALEEIQAAVERRWAPVPPEEVALANFDTPEAIAATVVRVRGDA